MNAGAVVFARLANQTTAATRVYPLLLPQQPTFPAVTYQQVSATRTHAMGQDGPIIRVRVQVNCWGKTYAEARALAGEVEQQLSRYRGEAGGAKVLDVLLDSDTEGYESESQTRRVMQDYTLFLSTN